MNTRNDSNSSRRTSSSPYLASLPNQSSSQYRPRPRPRPQGNKNRSSRLERPPISEVPPRGSRSAPPVYSSVDSEIRDYYQRKAEQQREVQKSFLKTKLNRLTAYQERLAKEIDDLERSCGDAGIRLPRQNVQTSQPSSKAKLKQFRVLGGCPGNLSYKIHRKPDKEGKIRSFSLEVDIRGFMAENVEIITEDHEMFIRASKMNGMKKDLKIIAPSLKDMEKAYIHPPRFGVLLIDF